MEEKRKTPTISVSAFSSSNSLNPYEKFKTCTAKINKIAIQKSTFNIF